MELYDLVGTLQCLPQPIHSSITQISNNSIDMKMIISTICHLTTDLNLIKRNVAIKSSQKLVTTTSITQTSPTLTRSNKNNSLNNTQVTNKCAKS